MIRLFPLLCAALLASSTAQAVILYDQDVTPGVIFGSGNANGSWTVDRSGGVELGLRAKLRHDANGNPQNIFNSNGDGTYSFDPGVAPTQASPTGIWSFEWSVNTDYDDTSGYKLGDLAYTLSITNNIANVGPASFDMINLPYGDHSLGDNTTTDATNIITPANDQVAYANNIATNNVAQNSWKAHWFVPGYSPLDEGTYDFVLSAFDGSTLVAETAMTVVVPEPGTYALLLGTLALAAVLRRRKA